MILQVIVPSRNPVALAIPVPELIERRRLVLSTNSLLGVGRTAGTMHHPFHLSEIEGDDFLVVL
jgi:hypothetical protein